MIGLRLGPYEVTARLGEGEMGEVYRGAARYAMVRFERDGRASASLNLPNICTFFDVTTARRFATPGGYD